MCYEDLLIEAQNTNVIVKELNLNEHDGLCIGNVIFIDRHLTDTEKACVMIEELSHHDLTVGNITDQTRIENRKQERIARRHAFEKLISVNDIAKAIIDGTKNRYEMAEYLGVTEPFLDESLNYYKEKYGLFYKANNYIIYFDPLWLFKY